MCGRYALPHNHTGSADANAVLRTKHSPSERSFMAKKKQSTPQFNDITSDLSCFFEAEISQSYHEQGISPYGRGYREALQIVQVKLHDLFEAAANA